MRPSDRPTTIKMFQYISKHPNVTRTTLLTKFSDPTGWRLAELELYHMVTVDAEHESVNISDIGSAYLQDFNTTSKRYRINSIITIVSAIFSMIAAIASVISLLR